MKNPAEIARFKDYTHVHMNKFLIEADTHGMGKELSAERRVEITNNFSQVKEKFAEVVCKCCNKTRTQGSWTRMSIEAQARAISDELRSIYSIAYLEPTFLMHSTDWGLNIISDLTSGKVELLNDETEANHAARAVVLACKLMGHLAQGIDDYYKLNATDCCTRITDGVNLVTKELLVVDSANDATLP